MKALLRRSSPSLLPMPSASRRKVIFPISNKCHRLRSMSQLQFLKKLGDSPLTISSCCDLD